MTALETIENPIDVLRLVNAVLTITTAALLAFTFNVDWHRLTRGIRWVVLAQMTLLLVIAYGSVESLYQGAPAGVRSILVTVVCALLLAGLALHHYDTWKAKR